MRIKSNVKSGWQGVDDEAWPNNIQFLNEWITDFYIGITSMIQTLCKLPCKVRSESVLEEALSSLTFIF